MVQVRKDHDLDLIIPTSAYRLSECFGLVSSDLPIGSTLEDQDWLADLCSSRQGVILEEESEPGRIFRLHLELLLCRCDQLLDLGLCQGRLPGGNLVVQFPVRKRVVLGMNGCVC